MIILYLYCIGWRRPRRKCQREDPSISPVLLIQMFWSWDTLYFLSLTFICVSTLINKILKTENWKLGNFNWIFICLFCDENPAVFRPRLAFTLWAKKWFPWPPMHILASDCNARQHKVCREFDDVWHVLGAPWILSAYICMYTHFLSSWFWSVKTPNYSEIFLWWLHWASNILIW